MNGPKRIEIPLPPPLRVGRAKRKRADAKHKKARFARRSGRGGGTY